MSVGVVKADLQNYLRSQSDMSKLSFNDMVDPVVRVLGKGGCGCYEFS